MSCWLRSKSGSFKIRDGKGHSVPMHVLGQEPLFFYELEPEMFKHDSQIEVLADRPPPKEGAARLKKIAETKVAAEKARKERQARKMREPARLAAEAKTRQAEYAKEAALSVKEQEARDKAAIAAKNKNRDEVAKRMAAKDKAKA